MTYGLQLTKQSGAIRDMSNEPGMCVLSYDALGHRNSCFYGRDIHNGAQVFDAAFPLVVPIAQTQRRLALISTPPVGKLLSINVCHNGYSSHGWFMPPVYVNLQNFAYWGGNEATATDAVKQATQKIYHVSVIDPSGSIVEMNFNNTYQYLLIGDNFTGDTNSTEYGIECFDPLGNVVFSSSRVYMHIKGVWDVSGSGTIQLPPPSGRPRFIVADFIGGKSISFTNLWNGINSYFAMRWNADNTVTYGDVTPGQANFATRVSRTSKLMLVEVV